MRISLLGEKVRVSFSYNPALIEEVRGLSPHRRWDSVIKAWLFPLRDAERVVDWGKERGFYIDPAVVEEIEKARKLIEANITASQAVASDLRVEGLKGELRPFQRAGVEYALTNRRVFIADEMGLGKTVQALATIEAAGAYPALVVCPASLKYNWAREAERWLARTVEVLNGNGSETRAEIVICNYDIVKKHLESLKARGFRAVVLDESHYVKNYRAQRTEACREVMKGVPYRLCLTGTPVLNRPQELLSQLGILGRLDDFGGFWEFARRYCDARKTRWGWDLSGASNLEELNLKLRATCFIRREKKEVLRELPSKQRVVIPVEIDNRDEYGRALNDLSSWVREKVRKDEEFLKTLEGLSDVERRKAILERVNSAVERAYRAEQLVRVEALKQVVVKGKMAAVKEWVSDFLETGEKLVLFAQHKEVVEELSREYGALKVLGDMDSKARQATVDRFQNDPGSRLIVLNMQAGGVGLTLTAASNVAFIELGWTPGVHDQAEDRCHRIGQEGSVTAWYLLGRETIDEDIYDLIEQKRAVVESVTEGGLTEEMGVLQELLCRL